MESTRPEKKSRTIEWVDPSETLARAVGMSGLDYMQAMMDGEVPLSPIGVLMGMEPVSGEEGRAVIAVNPSDFHLNPVGTIHGGMAATMLDSVIGCAVHTTLPAGGFYSTIEIKVTYLRALTAESGRVLCEGRVLHRGKRIAMAEASMTDEETGKLIAHATSTCLLQLPE